MDSICVSTLATTTTIKEVWQTWKMISMNTAPESFIDFKENFVQDLPHKAMQG